MDKIEGAEGGRGYMIIACRLSCCNVTPWNPHLMHAKHEFKLVFERGDWRGALALYELLWLSAVPNMLYVSWCWNSTEVYLKLVLPLELRSEGKRGWREEGAIGREGKKEVAWWDALGVQCQRCISQGSEVRGEGGLGFRTRVMSIRLGFCGVTLAISSNFSPSICIARHLFDTACIGVHGETQTLI